MGNEEEKKKVAEYQERLKNFKNDVSRLSWETGESVAGSFSLSGQIAIRDVRLTTCRHIELALDSA